MQGRSDGGYIGIYTPKISLPYNFLCGYWLFFFSLTQNKFDIVPVCALARVSFTYLHTTIYTPQMKFLATPLLKCFSFKSYLRVHWFYFVMVLCSYCVRVIDYFTLFIIIIIYLFKRQL